jgi:hypothetical protein
MLNARRERIFRTFTSQASWPGGGATWVHHGFTTPEMVLDLSWEAGIASPCSLPTASRSICRASSWNQPTEPSRLHLPLGTVRF